MKKFFWLILFLISSYAYSQQISTSLKVKGEVFREYLNYTSPIEVKYKAYVYEGSGNYNYRWRQKGTGEYITTEEPLYTLSFDCETNRRPEITVFCEVVDLETQNKFILTLRHPVEMCTNNN